jgi:methylated-DNA-[protein]-cysteine S-methyltransferase
MTSPFEPLDHVDSETEDRLRAKLIEAAEHAGVLDITYGTVDTPVGTLLLIATEEGLLRVAYESEGHGAVLERVAVLVSPRILRAPARLDVVRRQFGEYFEGHRTEFDVPLDFRLSKGFRRTVLRHLQHIDYGSTESYAEVATASGSPRAVRAVGSACSTNPLPVVVPCHRVIRSDGALGEYVGGSEVKEQLLTMEAV